METKNNNTAPSIWVKHAKSLKAFMLLFLILILLIPLKMVKDLINERAQRQQTVVQSIQQKWGVEVKLFGPMIKVPYWFTETVQANGQQKNQSKTRQVQEWLYIFPDELDIKTAVEAEQKQYGIYKATAFSKKSNIKGSFSKNIPAEFIQAKIAWDKAKIIIMVSNIKGIVKEPIMVFKHKSYKLTNQGSEGFEYQNFYELGTEELIIAAGSNTYQLDMIVHGTDQISYIPIGKSNKVALTSNWETANYFGSFLPQNTGLKSQKGITANWSILEMNRPFKQCYLSQVPSFDNHSFGINFIPEVNDYLKTERTAKYGLLVIGLTFLAFFLLQLLNNLSLHPIQYLIIGFALTLFYVLLLSISEHGGFNMAYLTAGLSVVMLIAAYTKGIFNSNKSAIYIASMLLIIYGFLYVIIQLQSHSLLFGSIGLLIILALVMYTSRKMDWTTTPKS